MEKLEILKKEIETCKKYYYYYMKMYDKAEKYNDFSKINDIKTEITIWRTRMEQTDYLLYLLTK